MADAFIGFDARYRKLDTNEIERKIFWSKSTKTRIQSEFRSCLHITIANNSTSWGLS
jgi:hypothetical protein